MPHLSFPGDLNKIPISANVCYFTDNYCTLTFGQHFPPAPSLLETYNSLDGHKKHNNNTI